MASGGMSERHFRRLRDVYEESGPEGLIDRRRGRANGRRAPVDEIEWVLGSFRTRYFDFRIKHFHEVILGQAMADGAPFKRSYSWTKSVLQSRGLVGKAKVRGKHRRKRLRKPLPGMMLLQPFGGLRRLQPRLACRPRQARSDRHDG